VSTLLAAFSLSLTLLHQPRSTVLHIQFAVHRGVYHAQCGPLPALLFYRYSHDRPAFHCSFHRSSYRSYRRSVSTAVCIPSSTCFPPSTAPTAPTSLYRSSYPAVHRSVYHAQYSLVRNVFCLLFSSVDTVTAVQHSTAPSTALPTALSTALPPLLHSTALTALPTALTAALHQPLSVYLPQRVILALLLFARHWYYRSFHRYIHRCFCIPSSTCVDATHDVLVLALPPSTAPTWNLALPFFVSQFAVHRFVYHAQCGPWFVTYSACSSLLSIQSWPSSIPPAPSTALPTALPTALSTALPTL
jgi:hypothetical protein